MRACCFRVFVDGELWDCLLVVKHNRNYALYTSVDRLPSELHPLRLDNVRGSTPTVVDANCLERVIKALEYSDVFKRSALRRMNAVVTHVVDSDMVINVNDISLVPSNRYRLPYTWYTGRTHLIARTRERCLPACQSVIIVWN
jgi:hypothetical protein